MRALPSIAAAAMLLLAGCTDNYGRVDYGRTALLGIGVGAAAALAAGALSDRPRPYRGGGYARHDGYGHGSYSGYHQPYYGRRGGYGQPYRGGW